MNKKQAFVFFVIIVFAVFLRFYKLDLVPPGVNRDEASIGYTAYSILTTGKDEYGRSFPISFQSFGDWKLPFYIYVTVPVVALFGLSEFAVRIPSAIFGILSVIATFYLVDILFKKKVLSFMAMFFMAISPWSLHLSRVESESNTAVFFVILGAICFIKSFGKRQWLIILSAFLLSLTYFIYAGNHVFTTLLVVGLIFIYRKQLAKTPINFIAIILFLSLSIFIFFHTLFGADKTKLSGIGIFGDPSVIHTKIETPRNEHPYPQSFFAKVAHNKLVFAGEKIAQNYLNSFSPQFLFKKGGENRAHNILDFGNLYLVEAPFIILGIFYLVFFLKGREKYLVLWWFLIGPIAASITKDAPHTNRMFAIFPILPLMTAFGLYWFFTSLIRQKLFNRIGMGLVSIVFVINFLIYMDRYYVHFPKNEVGSWGLGYKELNRSLSSPQYASKKVIMERPHYSPYIYLLFYSAYSPSKYQKEAERYPKTSDGFVDVKSFGRFEFRNINWNKDLNSDNVLISWTSDVPEKIKRNFKTSEISLPNGESMFTIIETR